MAIFRTPTDNFVTPILAEFDIRGNRLSEEQRLANRLARHVEPTARGRNVYLLTNGTFTEIQPSNIATVNKVYYGGHDIEVTAEEVAALTAAGYGSNISG
jgi:hypothetical protein